MHTGPQSWLLSHCVMGSSGWHRGVCLSWGLCSLDWLELAICALGFGGLWAKCVLLAREAHLWVRTEPFSPSRSTELLFTELDFERRYSDPPAVAKGPRCCPPWGWWGQSGWAPATHPVSEATVQPSAREEPRRLSSGWCGERGSSFLLQKIHRGKVLPKVKMQWAHTEVLNLVNFRHYPNCWVPANSHGILNAIFCKLPCVNFSACALLTLMRCCTERKVMLHSAVASWGERDSSPVWFFFLL